MRQNTVGLRFRATDGDVSDGSGDMTVTVEPRLDMWTIGRSGGIEGWRSRWVGEWMGGGVGEWMGGWNKGKKEVGDGVRRKGKEEPELCKGEAFGPHIDHLSELYAPDVSPRLHQPSTIN